MLSTSSRRRLARVAFFVAAFGALILLLGPFQGLDRAFPLGDKAAHATAFYILSLMSYLAFPQHRRSDLAFAAIVLGGLSEVLQHFTHRDMEIGDWIADAVGALAAFVPGWVEAARSEFRGGMPDRRARGSRRRRSPVGGLADLDAPERGAVAVRRLATSRAD